MKMRHFILTLAATSVMIPAFANAQQARLPGVIDKPTPQLEAPRGRDLAIDVSKDEKKSPQKKTVANPNKVVATLKSVTFEGNSVMSSEALQTVVASYLNRPLTNGDLAQMKYDVAKAYYDQGYTLVNPITPPQNMKDGVLKMQVYEAKLGDLRVNNNAGVRPWLVNHYMKSVPLDQVYNEKDVESTLADINDLSGVRATVALVPGTKFNTTDPVLTLDTAPNEEVNHISIDNYGSELTGEVVNTLALEKTNFFGMGEKLDFNMRHSWNDLWSYAGAAEVPLPIYNTFVNVNVLHSENDIGDRLAALDSSGETNMANVSFAFKPINQRRESLSLSLGMEARQHESFLSDVRDTKDNIRQLFTEATYLYNKGGKLLYGSLKLSKGISVFGASDKGDTLASRALGEPDAWIVNPTVYANVISPFSDGSFKLLSTAQAASNTLLSSDLFVLGGYGSVRGFDVAKETGEMGYNFNVEYNHNIPLEVDHLSRFTFGPFLDGGAVKNRIVGASQDSHLYSAGLGSDIELDLLPVGATKVRLDYARSLGDYNDAEAEDNNTFYFRVSQEF